MHPCCPPFSFAFLPNGELAFFFFNIKILKESIYIKKKIKLLISICFIHEVLIYLQKILFLFKFEFISKMTFLVFVKEDY